MRGRPPQAPGLRDAAFVCCLTLVLTIGVIGVLLLNTSMQQQSGRLDGQHQQLTQLTSTVQQLRTRLDEQDDPARLAVQARRLHMHPARQPAFVVMRGVSAQRQAAAPNRAG